MYLLHVCLDNTLNTAYSISTLLVFLTFTLIFFSCRNKGLLFSLRTLKHLPVLIVVLSILYHLKIKFIIMLMIRKMMMPTKDFIGIIPRNQRIDLLFLQQHFHFLIRPLFLGSIPHFAIILLFSP